jgi:hypothetical protein
VFGNRGTSIRVRVRSVRVRVSEFAFECPSSRSSSSVRVRVRAFSAFSFERSPRSRSNVLRVLVRTFSVFSLRTFFGSQITDLTRNCFVSFFEWNLVLCKTISFLFHETLARPVYSTICTSAVTLVSQAPLLSCIMHLCTSCYNNNKVNHLKYGISICRTENQRKAREISRKRFPYKHFEFKVSYEENYEIYFKKVPSRCARERSKENTNRGFSIRDQLD